MSDITSSYDSDSTFNSIEEYFGQSVSVDDIVGMSEEERTAYFSSLYASSGITEEDYSTFLDEFETECETYYDQAYVAKKELEAMLDSGNLTVGEAASIELLIADLDEIMVSLDDEFSSEWGDAQNHSELLNRTLTAGSTETVTFDDIKEGETIVIDASASKAEDSGSAFDVEGEGYVDTDGDNVTDSFWDEDADGVADTDINGDGAITEEDNPFFEEGYNSNTVIIDGEGVTDITLSNYDNTVDPEVSTFRIQKEDGSICYVEIKGNCKIVCSPPPSNLDSVPSELSQRMFEFTNSKEPYSFYIDGSSSNDEINYFSVYDTKDFTDNEVGVTVTSSDIEQGRDYTINCEGSSADVINIDIPDNADVTIKKGSSNDQVILTITTDEGTSTITINNYDIDGVNIDQLNLSGGTITTGSYNNLKSWTQGDINMYDMIQHDGQSIYEEGEEAGYDWTSPFIPGQYVPNDTLEDIVQEGEEVVPIDFGN